MSSTEAEAEVEYVPTLGEYAAVIEWLESQRGMHQFKSIPRHLRRAFDDAMHRAGLRRVARAMENHEPDNPQGVWCCDSHRDAYYAERAASQRDIGPDPIPRFP